MYFSDKFDKNIQYLARKQKKGASTKLGDAFNDDLFYRERVSNREEDGVNETVLVIPLVMYDYISSSNTEDKVYDVQNQEETRLSSQGNPKSKELCVVCKDTSSTTITAGEKQ